MVERTSAGNRETWQELSGLLDVADRHGLHDLKAADLYRLGQLYRRVTSDLSEIRSTSPGSETAEYLNQLATRAYAAIYARGSRRKPGLRHLFASDIPRTFRRRIGYVAVSFGVSLLAAMAAFTAVRVDARWATALMPGGNVAVWEDFAAGGTPAGSYFAGAAEAMGGAGFSGLLISNNVQVALKAFAFGITLGLGTLAVLMANGAMLGVFFGVAANAHQPLLFSSVVAPHGFLELSAVFIAGGAGLMLGHTLADPGDRLRRDALRIAAADAVKLAVATVPMFVVAGLVEAMVSPQVSGLFAADLPRLTFGLLVAAIAWLYLLFGDRVWGDGTAP